MTVSASGERPWDIRWQATLVLPLGGLRAFDTRLQGRTYWQGRDLWFVSPGESVIRVCFDDRVITVGREGPNRDALGFVHEQVVPRLLAHDGQQVLHAGAARIGGGGLLWLGQTGAGKSTLAAALMAAGHAVQADDSVLIRDGANGMPRLSGLVAHLRLRPDSHAALFGGGGPADPDQRHRVPTGASGAAAVPVRGILLLEPASDPEAPVTLHAVPPAEACAAILAQSFALDPDDAAAAVVRLRAAARLAGAVPVRRLVAPHRFDRLAEVVAAVEQFAGEVT